MSIAVYLGMKKTHAAAIINLIQVKLVSIWLVFQIQINQNCTRYAALGMFI